MAIEEIIEKYNDKFGGFPAFLLQGISDEELGEMMLESLRTGKPIEVEIDEDSDY